MKKVLFGLVAIAVAASLVWVVWFKPGKHEEEETKPPTEVTVQVGKIARADLRAYVTAYGVVEPEPPDGQRPAASARVASAVAGVVAAVKCAEGQRVEKGALLFELDSRAADVAAEKAGRLVAFAEKNLERQKRLMQAEGTSQKLLQEAEQAWAAAKNELAAAQTQQALLRIEAPIAGTITRINLKAGEAVDLATPLAELIDLNRLVVTASVPSGELAPLKTGQAVEVVAENSEKPAAGSLTFIGQQVDPKMGTATVRAALSANSGLRPGQFVTLRIVSDEHKNRLAVPKQSVVKDSEGATVIALVQKDKAVLKPVKVGLRDGGLIEIEAEGLQADMPIVTEGTYGLPKETKIKVQEKEEHSRHE